MGKWGPGVPGPHFTGRMETRGPHFIGKTGTPVWQTIFWELKDPIQIYSRNQQLDDDKHRSGFSTSTTAKIVMYVIEGEPSLF